MDMSDEQLEAANDWQESNWCDECCGIGEQFPMVICRVCKGTGVKEDK